MNEFKMLVNGALVTAPSTFDVVNPDTAQVIAQVPDISSEQVIQVLEGAKASFTTWSKTSIAQREALVTKYVELLEANKTDIIDTLIAETGKPLDNAEYDFGMLVTCLRFFIEEIKRIDQPVIQDPEGRFHHFIKRQPLGVVVGYLAWNFPLLNFGYKLAPALAAGCTSIIKPSQVTPLATLKCAKLALDAGFPAGVVNVITSNNYDVTNPLLTSDIPALFTMIGSTKSGINAMKTACTSVKHFSVELGGNAPVIVYDDADVDQAAIDIVNLKYGNSGQVCVSPNRCFVHRSVYEEFINKAATHANGITLGTGTAIGADEVRLMGPMISDKERQRILTAIEQAIADGAQLVLGGQTPKDKAGFYLQPTILADCTPQMSLTCNEIFGPVLAVIPFDDKDDIIAMANDSEYGLAAYVYTTSLQKGMQAAEQIIAGSVCINEAHYSVQLPHGGLKQSGVGKDCSAYSLTEYLTNKRISVLVKE